MQKLKLSLQPFSKLRFRPFSHRLLLYRSIPSASYLPHSTSWYYAYSTLATSNQDLLSEIHNSFDKARQMRKYGVSARQEALSHYNNALDAFNKLSRLEHLSSDLVEIMLQIHANKGRILLVEKNLEDARNSFQSVLDLIRKHSLYNETAELYFDISISYLNSLTYEKAVSILKKALQTNPQNLIVSQFNQHETAVDKLRKVVEAVVETCGEVHEDTAAIYLAFGDMLLIQQQYDEAKLAFKNALNTITALFGPDPQQLFYYYNAIGQLYSKINDQEVETQVYLKETSKLNDKFRYDELGLASDYITAGDIYSSRREYEKALMSYHKALRILNKYTDKDKERLVKNSISKCSALSGNV